ncbi:LytTR family DNA-binding domain-containing protein [Cytophagaceae bacterium DM2B3-1]|uniref:LytTR family DNA-binding domain-containing protein n=1 Tax=Xanthocytophaga flava TaxID=3048013 RepID=A0ABT7CZT6_9BACT|nr:LytTR family DNA-binding domain-containing protein [Xanthocytophaga flavus]MDJ1498485.1 LytTR family DNA-binding domain-containing protein [Xanthocytophaga flavus]
MTRQRWLQISGAAFFALFLVTFNSSPLVELLRRQSYYRDLSITFGAAWLIISYVGWITGKLDSYIDWQSDKRQRLLLQILLGITGASLISYGIAYFQYRFIDPEHVFGTESFLQTELPVIVLLITFCNIIYVSISYYHWQERRYIIQTLPVAEKLEPSISYLSYLIVTNGQKSIQLAVEHVALIYLEQGITWVATFNNTRYHVDEPLQSIEDKLDPGSFFRVNRQTIVQLSACYSFQSMEYGKIKLHLVPPFTTELTISQKTAPAFRKWMQRLNT